MNLTAQNFSLILTFAKWCALESLERKQVTASMIMNNIKDIQNGGYLPPFLSVLLEMYAHMSMHITDIRQMLPRTSERKVNPKAAAVRQ